MINKPINIVPYNCCVDVSSDLKIKYEIPNNEKIDGRYISINDMETGESVLESYENLSEPTSKIEWNAGTSLLEYNNNEYSWSSFYWQTPMKDPNARWTVSNIDTQNGNINIVKGSQSAYKISPTYTPSGSGIKDAYSMIADMRKTDQTYDSTAFGNCGHKKGDDTSDKCYAGVLEDYFGYGFFKVSADNPSRLVDLLFQIGLGKCIINICDNSNRLIARAKCLAYDYNANEELFKHYIIIDNINFVETIKNKFGTKQVANHWTSAGDIDYYQTSCIPYTHAYLFSTESINGKENISGMIGCGETYSYIENCEFSSHEYVLSTLPNIAEKIQIGDTVEVWSNENANFNTTPTYYFRTKSTPETSINIDALEIIDGVKTLKDVKCEVGVTYNSLHSKINYFYLYLYVLNPKTSTWELMERSPMLNNVDAKYEFVGFVDGYTYKVCGVYTDQDGDEWESEDVNFSVSNPAISIYNFSTSFNSKTTTIDVSLEEILRVYKNASLEFYKVLKSDTNKPMKLRYAGGGLCKTGGEYGTPNDKHHIYDGSIISFDRWCDYNIKNDSYYDYYVRVSYTGRNYDLKNRVVNQDSYYNLIGYDENQGFDFLLVATDVHTEFEGTSILGLEKISQTQLGITNNFNLFYNIDNKDMGELTNEISREYINSFNEYPKELKGHQNYFTGQCSGLLGSECKGVYEEPKGIRDAWKSFVNDDTIKFYRGIDGETMIISIDSSRVKPFYFPGAGLVNEVYITFKEIASTEPYAIFGTQKDR